MISHIKFFLFVWFFFFTSFVLIVFFYCFFFIVLIMINISSFCFVFVEFHRHFKVRNSKIKRFLNETVFLNFICVITSMKFFIDFVTKTAIPNLNNLKNNWCFEFDYFASFALVQMSENVVENSNSLNHFFLIHLNESMEIKWKIMISFIINFDNSIIFYSLFRFFPFFFWPFPRVDLFASHHTPAGRTDGGGKWKKSCRCVFLLN